ncbi:hypothetical protein BASA81_015076 [Batrachochytrium salamandrivorans]|nr:hypothetical protein BASA81_015076 [Batrachochytrium salamandrivorans]
MGDSIFDRFAELGAMNEGEQVKTLDELYDVLDTANVQSNKVRAGLVLEQQAGVRDVILRLDACSADVATSTLWVLVRLAHDRDNATRVLQVHPELIRLLVNKLDAGSEQIQVRLLHLMSNLANSPGNAKGMLPVIVPMLLSKLSESDSPEPVQAKALSVLTNLTNSDENATEMLTTYSPVLLPVLLAKMYGDLLLPTVKVLHNLSCPVANRTTLRAQVDLINGLTQARQNRDKFTALVSLLSLVYLFGAEERSQVLHTDAEMLAKIFDLIPEAMNRVRWRLNEPLLGFRYLCVVENNRRVLWDEYRSGFFTTLFKALWRAVEDADEPAADNAMSIMAQFGNDPEPLAWMRANRSQLDEVMAELTPFPNATKTAQLLLLSLDPPKVASASLLKPTIMISYNWKHQAQARTIHDIVVANGFTVWRDEQDMKTDIVDAMADAVSKSAVVLVLVSSHYKESANCQMECKFAHNNHRKLVPVLLEDGYDFKADGWLGLLLGSKLYYDVSKCGNDRTQLETVVMGLLVKEVEQHAPLAVMAETPIARRPVPQNEREIRQWLSTAKKGEEIADKLVRQELVEADELERLSKMTPSELKGFLDLTSKEALALEAALREIF